MVLTRDLGLAGDESEKGPLSYVCPERLFQRPVRVGIVCDDQSCLLANTVESLLTEYPGFSARVFNQVISPRSRLGKRDANEFGADEIVACLHTSEVNVASDQIRNLRDRFVHQPILLIAEGLACAEVFNLCQFGITDFLLPPIRHEDLLPRLWQLALTNRRNEQLRERLKERIGMSQIIGECPAFQNEIRRLPRIATCNAPALVTGESGTGKEVVARAIHYLSLRSHQAFIPLNCGAIPEALVESELFGHKRGAFTGAVADRIGLIQEAEGGTLFLDEIDSLPHAAQVKLLRFLQEREFRVVGASETKRADVRVIAATNADVDSLVREGKLRKDIYYRLNVLRVTLPSLRERRSDIPLLAQHFLEKHALVSEQAAKVLSPAAIRRLMDWHWPGNVRELENSLARAHYLAEGMVVQPEDCGLPEATGPSNVSFRAQKAHMVSRFEREYLERVLWTHNGNITQAAKEADKNRRAFWELLRKHGFLQQRVDGGDSFPSR